MNTAHFRRSLVHFLPDTTMPAGAVLSNSARKIRSRHLLEHLVRAQLAAQAGQPVSSAKTEDRIESILWWVFSSLILSGYFIAVL